MERHTVLLLIAIVIFAILFFMCHSYFTLRYEGFTGAPSQQMAQLPKPEGASTVPNTMPGAVSRDPTEALASYKDIAALLDVMKTYNAMYEKFLINLVKKTDYTQLHTKSIAYSIKLQAQIDTGKVVDSLKFVTDERKKYEEAIKSINRNEPLYKSANMNKAKQVTKNLVKDYGPVKVTDLEHTIKRAKNEQKRIDDIRSEAPDFKQRSLILEKIQLDLQQMVDKIKRKDMKESEIPINKSELKNFLVDVEDPTSMVSPLPRMSPAEVRKQMSRKDPLAEENKMKQKRNVTANFIDYPEDRKIIRFLESVDPSKAVEGFTSDMNDGGMSDMEAQLYAEGFKNKEEEFEDEEKPASGFVGDDEHFTPSNKLDNYADYQSPVEEGFSNYTNNYIHDKEDRDEEFKVKDKPPKTIEIPKEYRNAIAKLKSSMRDLTWDMNIGVGYDPNVTIQRRVTERLNQISNEIESGRLNKEQLRGKFMELEILKQQLITYNRRNMSASQNEPSMAGEDRPYASANTADNEPISRAAPDVEEQEQAAVKGNYPKKAPKVVQKIVSSIEKPLASTDYRIRPGYEMSSEEINQRGSRASFDPTLVGGPNYKKNVKFLCSQIKAAGLGDPKEFGCIANQDTDVGPEYSWKGNYKMVCSRLGNAWGEWYPEMFGCPKPNTSHSQIPKINKDCTASKLPPLEHPPKPSCGIVQP